jgi:demethylmenaquinone methyltransferase/2-methoxy-6-polyprenyl-1,4-benzoquinol methylase
MFSRIAPRYDLMNRLMTGGQDVGWRQQVIRLAEIPPGGRVLDLGTGTGDLSREALRQSPGCRVTSADFTLNMMLVGKQQPGRILDWTGADALHLPFPEKTFDALVSGFLLRNLVDLPGALQEQYRVLKPGGRLVALDTTRPRPSLFSPLIKFHMHQVIPFLGGLLTRSRDAYEYLPDTTENFLLAEDLQRHIEAAGFEKPAFRRLMFGTIAIHWALKPVEKAYNLS